LAQARDSSIVTRKYNNEDVSLNQLSKSLPSPIKWRKQAKVLNCDLL